MPCMCMTNEEKNIMFMHFFESRQHILGKMLESSPVYQKQLLLNFFLIFYEQTKDLGAFYCRVKFTCLNKTKAMNGRWRVNVKDERGSSLGPKAVKCKENRDQRGAYANCY